MFRRLLPAALLAMSLALPLHAAEPAAFPLKDGDVWVMAGDSITAQHLHSNYFEAFCYARYPKLKFAFRNSGVGGHTIPSTLARFDYDVAGWKPTVVSVELGMNDAGGTPTDKFVSNMGTMVARIREAGARPVILSASPVNDGLGAGKFAARNARLDEYATALKAFAEKEKIPYADQFHALVEVWAKNKQDAKGVNLTGDAVHPGAPGQLMMAAALLKALGAEGFVSEATLDAAGDRDGCEGMRDHRREGRRRHPVVRPAGRDAAVPDPGQRPGGSADRPGRTRPEQVHAEGDRVEGGRLHADDQRGRVRDAVREGPGRRGEPDEPARRPEGEDPEPDRRPGVSGAGRGVRQGGPGEQVAGAVQDRGREGRPAQEGRPAGPEARPGRREGRAG